MNTERLHILITKEQQKFLKRASKITKLSIGKIIRTLVDDYKREKEMTQHNPNNNELPTR